MTADLTFAELAAKSRSRCDRWHTPDTEPWTGADFSNAMVGEVGEAVEAALALIAALTAASGRAANTVKKLRRHETGIPDKIPVDQLRDNLGGELGDVQAYLVLLADHFGLDLGECTARKFNAVSLREGFPERLGESATRPTWLSDGDRGWFASERDLDLGWTAYGVKLSTVGEDGAWMALGHVPPLRMIAAMRNVGRSLGLNDEEIFGYQPGDPEPLAMSVQHGRAAFTCPGPPAAEGGWWCYYGPEAAESEWSMPVTHWTI